jgi:hypothetical protein
MPAVPRLPLVSAASGHFFARSKRLNAVQSCPAKVCFEHDVNADVLFLGHEKKRQCMRCPRWICACRGLTSRFAIVLPETAACSWFSEPLTRPARR